MNKIYNSKTDISVIDLRKMPNKKIYLSSNGGLTTDGISWQEKASLLFTLDDDYCILDSSPRQLVDKSEQLQWDLYAMEIADMIIISSSDLKKIGFLGLGLYADSGKVIIYYDGRDKNIDAMIDYYGLIKFNNIVELVDWTKEFCEEAYGLQV